MTVMQDSMQNWTKAIGVQVVLSLTLLAGLDAYYNTPPVNAVSEKTLNIITVSGKGEISITPDVAYVQFGLLTEGKTAQEAQQKSAELFSRIQEEIKKQGVEKADIKTVRYNTQPDYRWEKEQNILKGYRSEHIVEVTYREMDAIGSLLDSVSKAGVNRIENIRFSTEKVDEYEIMALQNAVNNAKNKAEALAKISGKKIKEVLTIQELGTATPPVIYREAISMKAEAAMQDTSTTINQGQLTITSQVQVTYEF